MPIVFRQHRFPNGLTLLAECNADAHTAAVGFFVKTGTRDEDRRLMGVSHFLEHMMFKGTARRSADDVNREFDEIGANYNAFTSHEMTAYFAQVLPEFIPRAVDLIGDMLRPALRDEDFNMEKNVILEEIGMYEDRPQWRLQDHLTETYFGAHPLSFRVLGTAATVGALPVTDMRDYFRGHYGPDNTIVAAAGKIDFEQLVDLVGKAVGHWPPTGAKRNYDTAQMHPGDKRLADAKLTRHYLAAMSPAPSAQDPRRYAAKILTDVLGDSDGSRLYWALIDPGLADEASFAFEPMDQTGTFVAFVSCDPQRADKVEKILFATLDQYVQNIDADEIERAKNKIATQATLHGERPLGRMTSLGGTWLYLNEYLPLEEELARITAVTVEDVRSLLTQMPPTPRTIVRLGPQ